ncbi:hypothetical protein TWF102_006163 [Orbilia oligospora]|uniref:Uncharacterized protein n=1 Tax=Orbilia oligospora TaxID=2813651 RepID=A0A7C8NWY0_ORBOL|nr:hypothetical protein TWF706_009521 [Orbilia oligospora]KAF3098174.1 hypothetical protein TWF102_006163 [Orbilia oligospora]KAF3132738.1 hypothetical protein TWF703_007204 [Orbilia oligospora]KAF3151356.1 hypothetical protein TWF594_007005 [Orbilia oligospora]
MAAKTSTKLLDLSGDVLRMIFQHNVISLKDLKSLRLAHPGLHGAVDPLLFKTITVPTSKLGRVSYSAYSPFSPGGHADPSYPTFKISTFQLSSILERQVPRVIFDNAQSVILNKYDVYDGYPDENKIKQNFPQYSEEGIRGLEYFLCSMKKMRNLTWSIAYSNITQLIDLSPIAGKVDSLHLTGAYYGNIPPPEHSYKAFKDFSSLTCLTISFNDSADVKDLSYLPNLKTLNFTVEKAPQASTEQRRFDFVDFLEAQRVPFSLQRLSITACYAAIPIPKDLAQKFLSNLRTLYLRYLTPDAKNYPIIDALKDNNIKIKNLDIDGCHESILDYIGSYTDGLQSLEVNVDCLKDNEGFDDRRGEDVWAYSFNRRRWQEDITEKKKETFKDEIWKVLAAAHKNSLQRLVLANNFNLYTEEAEALSQCKALRTIDIKGDDWVLQRIIPVASKLPLLEVLKFEIPWTPRMPDMTGWCGTSQYDWHMKPKDIESRVKAMHWLEEDIDADGPGFGNVSFRVSGIHSNLKLVKRRHVFYPWILVGDGEMGIEGREDQVIESEEEEESEPGGFKESDEE